VAASRLQPPCYRECDWLLPTVSYSNTPRRVTALEADEPFSDQFPRLAASLASSRGSYEDEMRGVARSRAEQLQLLACSPAQLDDEQLGTITSNPGPGPSVSLKAGEGKGTSRVKTQRFGLLKRRHWDDLKPARMAGMALHGLYRDQRRGSQPWPF
jgi:hypothetical protein